MQPNAADRGQKHTCLRCQTKFYDLKRPALICPRCGADQATEAAKDKEAAAAKKRVRAKPAPKPEPVVEAAEAEDEELEGVGDDEDEDDEDEVADDDV